MSDVQNTEVEVSEASQYSLPDWVRAKLSEANAEAAKYRVKAKEAVEEANKAAELKYSEKIAGFEGSIQELEAAVASEKSLNVKLKVALGCGVGSDKVEAFAGLLKGDTEEELTAHAEELKQLFHVEPEKNVKYSDPSQGQGNYEHVGLNEDKLLTSVLNAINR